MASYYRRPAISPQGRIALTTSLKKIHTCPQNRKKKPVTRLSALVTHVLKTLLEVALRASIRFNDLFMPCKQNPLSESAGVATLPGRGCRTHFCPDALTDEANQSPTERRFLQMFHSR